MVDITAYEHTFLTELKKHVDELQGNLADEHYEPTVVEFYKLISEYFADEADRTEREWLNLKPWEDLPER